RHAPVEPALRQARGPIAPDHGAAVPPDRGHAHGAVGHAARGAHGRGDQGADPARLGHPVVVASAAGGAVRSGSVNGGEPGRGPGRTAGPGPRRRRDLRSSWPSKGFEASGSRRGIDRLIATDSNAGGRAIDGAGGQGYRWSRGAAEPMLKVSQKTEYAMRAMIELAIRRIREGDVLIPARAIAEAQQIPLRFQ